MLSQQSTEVMEITTLKVLGVVHLCTAKGDAHKVGRVVRWSRISLLFLTLVKDDILFSNFHSKVITYDPQIHEILSVAISAPFLPQFSWGLYLCMFGALHSIEAVELRVWVDGHSVTPSLLAQESEFLSSLDQFMTSSWGYGMSMAQKS